jgi:site-specific DNA recombinase
MRRRAALMARVSSDEQAKGYSLDIQSEALMKYCERNDIEVVFSFREDHSAKDFNRPAFTAFLEHAKRNRGGIDLLLFSSWDRFSRNIMDAYTMIDRLKRLGITPQAIEQPIDLNIPENKAILAMFLVIPEIDNDRRSIKIRGGMRAALKAGRWCRVAPYGYRNTRDMDNRPIIVPDAHSENIRWAFEQVSEGGSQADVVRELKTKGTPVGKSRLSTMLRNPMYMGMIEVPAEGSESYCVVKGKHDGIVSEDLFHKVQRVLQGNVPKKRISKATRDEHLPLRGILSCSKCGGRITGSRSRGRMGVRYAYYHCNGCSKERYRSEQVNNALQDIMNGFSLNKDAEILYTELVKRMLTGNDQERQVKATSLRGVVAKQEERIIRLQDNLADGAINPSDFREMHSRYSEQKRLAEQELNSLTEDTTGRTIMLRKAVSMVSRLGDFYANADTDSRLRLLSSIFPEKLEFDGEKCRTPRLNHAVALCLSIDGHFSEQKNRTLSNKLVVSGWVEPEGVEPSSKQQTNGLSTCLFPTCLSEPSRQGTT